MMQDWADLLDGWEKGEPVGVFPYTLTSGPTGRETKSCTTNGRERTLFHRLGAIDKVDVFEAVSFNGSEWFILFVDLYHPRRSRLAPDGFRFTKEVA